MDRFVRFLLTVLLFFLLVTSWADGQTGGKAPVVIRLPHCHQISFDNCLKENFFSFGRKPDVAPFVFSKHGFQQICRSFNESLSCIRTHLKRCGSPLHPIIFDLITGEMQWTFYQFMCTENDQRKVFFEHRDCLRENVFATDRSIPCLNNYLLAFEHVQEAFGSNYDPDNISSNSSLPSFTPLDWIHSVCCAHQLKRQCSEKLARESCGAQAASAFDIWFEQMHFGFFSILCRPASAYDPESAMCRAALPNRGQTPKGLRSSSAVSHLLVSYFPFNYVTVAKRNQIYELYRRRLDKAGKTTSSLNSVH